MAKNQHNAGLHYRPLNQLGLSNFNDHIENPIDSRFKFNPPPLKCGKLFGLCKVDRQKEELQKHCPWEICQPKSRHTVRVKNAMSNVM